MRILLLSFYYPPDIGPGSLRAKSIVESLVKTKTSNLEIDVITTMPNRYNSLKLSSLEKIRNGNIFIQRIELPKHKNGMFDQAKAFVSFSFKVRRLILNKKFDVVIATSSRLMTASLGAWVSKKTKSKLYLDIRDLFTISMDDILKKNPLRILIPIFYILEKWTFRSADKLNIVSGGFFNYLKKILPNKQLSIYTNGIDDFFLEKKFLIKKTKSKPIILYTGNIGDPQGLHKIIPEAAKQLKNVQFKLIGDGSAKNVLKKNNLFKSQKNIKLIKPILRKKLIKEFQKADILFLHLNNYKSLKKVLPSKIFEYAATGKPILAGVSGYSKKFLKENIKGAEVFNPCDIETMKIALQKLLKGPKIYNRKFFIKKYNRQFIMKKMAKDILSILK